ncbi:hypothetical protein [Ralstonia mannitolilytica]|uniref:hypothetical protein n=1 Tax=Ralstonia mannitolilytica TaxID=105219 RepID=UPI003B83D9BA
MQATDEIKTARRFTKDGGDWAIKCGHCGQIIGVDDGDLDGTPRGEQYQHRVCGGWTQVSSGAAFVKEL